MKILKITGIALGIIVVLAVGAGVYVKTALPNTGPAPDLKVESTPERIARGKYLAHHVTLCMDCHSTRDWQLFSGPMVAEGAGGGGEKFSKDMGFPGVFYAPNITPYALGSWTDGEIFRAVTTGVNKAGKALFPLMAYHRFGKMDKEDVYNIIAYIRTLPTVNKDNPLSEPDFPVSFLINTMPQPAQFTRLPDTTNQLAYGAYLVNAGGCVDCHSQVDKGNVIPGTEFGGGMAFQQPAGTLHSPNITSDGETGIGNWTKEAFVNRFRQYADSSYKPAVVDPKKTNTPMPWTMYAGMTPGDLGAVYDYLRSVPPLVHVVPR